MTLNRYTAACKPMIHQKLWAKMPMNYLYFASVVLSFVAYTEWFLTKCVYERTVDGWRFIGREKQTLAARFIGALTVLLVEIVNGILITCTVVSIRRQKKKQHQKTGRELNLILLTAVTCPVNLMQSLYDLSIAFNLKNPAVVWIQSQNTRFPVVPRHFTCVIVLGSSLLYNCRERLMSLMYIS
ncbi:hypothetical protein Y032_0019g3759 [Ancylostoma ceylanicum]|nr:hypothetical protein Y032_0019g3759 [Ancylostoma ceylanicum]